MLVIGSRKKPPAPEMEGTPPLFYGYFDLAWGRDEPQHSWRAEVQRRHGPWQPMPTVIGAQTLALADVTALRLVRDDARRRRLARGRDHASPRRTTRPRPWPTPARAELGGERGEITLTAAAPDRRTAYVAFYVDGQFKGITNNAPYSFNWNTRQVPDGEYVVEAQAQDADNQPPADDRALKIWVDNGRRSGAEGTLSHARSTPA